MPFQREQEGIALARRGPVLRNPSSCSQAGSNTEARHTINRLHRD